MERSFFVVDDTDMLRAPPRRRQPIFVSIDKETDER